MQMHAIGLSLWKKQRWSLTVGDKVKGAVFDVGEPCFVEAKGPLAGVVQSFRGDRIAF